MLSLGIFSALAAITAALSRAFMVGSGRPSLAATVISRASFEKSLERIASCLPFLCMMFLNWLWPAMGFRLKAKVDGAQADCRRVRFINPSNSGAVKHGVPAGPGYTPFSWRQESWAGATAV